MLSKPQVVNKARRQAKLIRILLWIRSSLGLAGEKAKGDHHVQGQHPDDRDLQAGGLHGRCQAQHLQYAWVHYSWPRLCYLWSSFRDPTSGKVKFLPLGRWRGTLQQEDLPVRYIVMSEHLDMVGVKLMPTDQKTRKINYDQLQDRVQKTIGPWRGGKFMSLTSRPHSINTYCLTKIWFRTSSINLRLCDLSNISATVSHGYLHPGELRVSM